MAQVPAGQKFHTHYAQMDSEERRYLKLNAMVETFTMQDIADTAGIT